ncbi:MAG: beta-ketoacyl synthase chain length factor [Bacteroidales bacterium]|jgi:hypothetical protein|nr:beta-ketoacyl synthase chain length factor [Bacteroidales bacterium]
MLYINAISTSDTLKKDIKELIPDAMLRRRMSNLVKISVATAMECLQNAAIAANTVATTAATVAPQQPPTTQPTTSTSTTTSTPTPTSTIPKATPTIKPDAIITATALGFIEDGEKFLRAIFEQQEQLLNPTPFIQSTFNTVGAQIALLTNNHCYNMTYCQREESFLHALLDAEIRISQHGARQILAGVFDEKTPTLLALLRRLHIKEPQREGAIFMLVSGEPQTNTIAEIDIKTLLNCSANTSPQTACSALNIPINL